MDRSKDNNYRSKILGKNEMERTGEKLFKNRIGLIFVTGGGKKMRIKEEAV